MRIPFASHGPAALPALLYLLISGAVVSCSSRFFVEHPEDLAAEASVLSARLAGSRTPGGGRFRAAEVPAEADIVLRLSASWSGESGSEGEGLILFHTPFVPAADIGRDALSPASMYKILRKAVPFADCISGAEAIHRVEDLEPASLVLRVDGKSLDEPDYPLVREVRAGLEVRGIRGRWAESGVRKLLAALGEEDRIASGAFRRILWISAAGDLMTGRGIDKRLRDGGPEAVFDPGVLRSLRGSDLALANLEGALTLRGSAARKTYTFRSDPSAASSLADAGFDALLLANNHSLDWGPAGLADTLEALAGAGIAGVGAGRDLWEASRPFRIEIKGQSVAVFGAARFPRERSGWDGARTAAAAGRPGILWLDEAGLDRLRASFRDDVLDIVLFHGGTEWSKEPDPRVRGIVFGLAEAGADIVLGSHPHVVQGLEWHRGRPILWSLGNLVFPGMDGTPGGEAGLLVRAGFQGTRLLYLDPVPLVLLPDGVREAAVDSR